MAAPTGAGSQLTAPPSGLGPAAGPGDGVSQAQREQEGVGAGPRRIAEIGGWASRASPFAAGAVEASAAPSFLALPAPNPSIPLSPQHLPRLRRVVQRTRGRCRAKAGAPDGFPGVRGRPVPWGAALAKGGERSALLRSSLIASTGSARFLLLRD